MTTSCRWVEERIEAWVDGELEADEARRVTTHLAGCAACAVAVESATLVRDGLRGLPSPDAPAAVIRRIKEVAGPSGSLSFPEGGDREGAAGAVARGPRRPASRARLAAELTLLAATLALALGVTLRWGAGIPATVGGAGADRAGASAVEAGRTDTSPADAQAAARAEREVRIALALVGRYTRRAGEQVRRELAADAVAGRTLRGLSDALAPLERIEGPNGGGPPSA